MRAEALVLLAELESVDHSVPLLEEALREADTRPQLQSAIHTRLASATRYRKGIEGALDHGRVALELADDLGDDPLRVAALTVLAGLGCLGGDAEAPAWAARAHELATAAGDPRLLKEANHAVANVLISYRNIQPTRELLEREYEEWRERDEPGSADILWSLAWVELWGGRWGLAADYAARPETSPSSTGSRSPRVICPPLSSPCTADSSELAREHSERALVLAEEQLGLRPPHLLAILGLVAFWSGDASGAVEWLGKADRRTAELGWREPCNRWWSADYVEVLLELGRTDEAVRVLDIWEADAARLSRTGCSPR